MKDTRSSLQTVAGLSGLILAWETDDSVIQARYDYGVFISQAPLRDGRAHLRATITTDADTDALLELSAFRGIAATLNGESVASAEPRLRPCGNSWPITLRCGENRLELTMDPEFVNPRVSARLCAPDRSALTSVTAISPAWEAVPEGLRADLPEGRNVSLWHEFNDMMTVQPRLRLAGNTEQAWREWRDAFDTRLRELMGPTEPVVDGDSALISSEDLGSYRRDRIILRTAENMHTPAWLLVPHKPNGAGIVSIHGHGYRFGETVGLDGGDEGARDSIGRLSYAYGARYAELGYVVINPDMRNFGARHDDERFHRDPCDAAALRLQQFGVNLIADQVRDLRACVDYLERQEAVDPARIGATGLSYGGRLTMYLAALDERVRCAVASGSLNVFRERLTIDSSCAAQFVPGLFTWGDTPEVFGLTAPRPMLLELGTCDGTSPELFANEAYHQIQRIYQAAGVPDRLDLDIFETGHRYSGVKAFGWFQRWLLDS